MKVLQLVNQSVFTMYKHIQQESINPLYTQIHILKSEILVAVAAEDICLGRLTE